MRRGALRLAATVIGVVGGKKSGKTTTIEILTKELTKKGYRVAVAKHIPEPNFTIDMEKKDTWRYGRAGAKIIVAASANELAVIERTGSELSLKEILKRLKDVDLVFLEGFRKLVIEDRSMPKIVVASSSRDVREAVDAFDSILAFTGPYVPKNAGLKIPYVDVIKHADKLVELVERTVGKEL